MDLFGGQVLSIDQPLLQEAKQLTAVGITEE